MILDHLSRHITYATLHPGLADGLRWLADRDWSAIADGRHVIAGESLFAIIESGTTFEADLRRYESHRTYLDIQFAISGGERIGWWPGGEVPVVEQAGSDLFFHRMPPDDGIYLPVLPGFFAVFTPGEIHKPCCNLDADPQPFRKCVLKVLWSS